MGRLTDDNAFRAKCLYYKLKGLFPGQILPLHPPMKSQSHHWNPQNYVGPPPIQMVALWRSADLSLCQKGALSLQLISFSSDLVFSPIYCHQRDEDYLHRSWAEEHLFPQCLQVTFPLAEGGAEVTEGMQGKEQHFALLTTLSPLY